MSKEQKEVFEKVMHVGEDHVYFRGGIGAVLSVYKKYFPAFQATGTHRRISNLGKIFYFGGNFMHLLWVMAFRPNVKIIHIHGSYGASVLRKFVVSFFAKNIFRKKVIYHIHSSEYYQKYNAGSKFYKRLCNYILHHADRVGCLTPKWKDLFTQKFGLSNSIVIHNMVSPPDFDFHNRKSHQEGEPIRFAFLGLIDEKKGIFDLVNMIAEHKTCFQGKVIIHIGGEGKSDQLKSIIEENGLQDIIDYKGWVNEEGKNILFHEVNGFILPSYNEGLPVCILEAMSFGLPIIATRVGGIPEIMEDGVNGFLFERGDKDAMKSAMMAYIENPYLLEEHGNASFNLVQRYYPERIIPEIEGIYRSLLRENSK